jgi:hypothetical protein
MMLVSSISAESSSPTSRREAELRFPPHRAVRLPPSSIDDEIHPGEMPEARASVWYQSGVLRCSESRDRATPARFLTAGDVDRRGSTVLRRRTPSPALI